MVILAVEITGVFLAVGGGIPGTGRAKRRRILGNKGRDVEVDKFTQKRRRSSAAPTGAGMAARLPQAYQDQ